MGPEHAYPNTQPGGILTILPPRPPAPPATGEGGDRPGGCWGGLRRWLRRVAALFTHVLRRCARPRRRA